MPRARKPPPVLHEVLLGEFGDRDANVLKLYRHVVELIKAGTKQDRRISQLEASLRKLEKRLAAEEQREPEELTPELAARLSAALDEFEKALRAPRYAGKKAGNVTTKQPIK
jgi:hypothetical protein